MAKILIKTESFTHFSVFFQKKCILGLILLEAKYNRPQRTDRMKSEMAAIVMALGIYINNVSTSLLCETTD